MKTSCDEFCASNECVQSNNCPARVAKAKPVMMAADPLPPSIWRYQLRKLAYWMLLAVLGVTVWPLMFYLALRA